MSDEFKYTTLERVKVFISQQHKDDDETDSIRILRLIKTLSMRRLNHPNIHAWVKSGNDFNCVFSFDKNMASYFFLRITFDLDRLNFDAEERALKQHAQDLLTSNSFTTYARFETQLRSKPFTSWSRRDKYRRQLRECIYEKIKVLSLGWIRNH